MEWNELATRSQIIAHCYQFHSIDVKILKSLRFRTTWHELCAHKSKIIFVFTVLRTFIISWNDCECCDALLWITNIIHFFFWKCIHSFVRCSHASEIHGRILLFRRWRLLPIPRWADGEKWVLQITDNINMKRTFVLHGIIATTVSICKSMTNEWMCKVHDRWTF